MDKQLTTNDINFSTELAEFIFKSKYARYNEKLKRRETLEECVDRVKNMHLQYYTFLDEADKQKIQWAFDLVKHKKIVPSMRSMQFGGDAIFAHHSRIYNCGVRHIDSIRAFAEFFYCLLTGTGMTGGLSKKYLNRLPNLVGETDKSGTVITYVVEDTIEGWADSVEALLMCYFKNTPLTGRKIVFDYSKIRKKGKPLKTGGGKAPGPKGLKQSHEKIKEILDYIIEVEGINRIRSIDVYDILMHCADAVLSGGIRRAATAMIFQKDDELMINSKVNFKVTKHQNFEKKENGKYHGFIYTEHRKNKRYEVTISEYEYEEILKKKKEISWIHIEPQRARSNNSVLLLRDNTTQEELEAIIVKTKQWGEPGFVFADHEDTLYNPCFEIGFIPVTEDGICGVQFCNLSSINGAKINSLENWIEAAEAATIIGTLQAGYTYFPYLSNASAKLTRDEALLGVSLTGWFANPEVLINEKNQYVVAKLVTKINEEWANKLSINKAARATCVKPEGTAGLFLEAPSGAHADHAHEFFRLVQMNKIDPIYKFFKKHNPHATEESVWSSTNSDDVIYWPITVSNKAIVKDDITAIDHLNYVRMIQENWVKPGTSDSNKKNVSHNVSVTVEVKDEEWELVIPYLFENRQFFSAVSMIGKLGDKDYPQAPLQRITTEEDRIRWKNLVENFKHVDYNNLIEEDDTTKLVDVAACAGGSCDITYYKQE